VTLLTCQQFSGRLPPIFLHIQVAFMVKAPGRRYTNEVEIKLSYVFVKDT